MRSINLYWRCPKCNEIVDFTKGMREVFSGNTQDGYEADFDPKDGLYFHTIFCEKCDSNWVVSISGICEPEK